MLCVRLLAVVFFGAVCSVAPGAEPPDGADIQRLLGSTSVPQDVAQVLQLVHSLARTGVYQRDDFYSEDVMRSLFGRDVTAKAARGAKISIVSMHGFVGLAEPDSSGQRTLSPGIWFEARKANNDKWSWMDVDFLGVMPGLDFADVVKSLGPEWKRDRRSESARDFAIGREPFNPPLPAVSHAMGRAIITYPAGTATLILEFDDEARLRSARSVGGCLGKPDCSAND
jgi:hypothetical protein